MKHNVLVLQENTKFDWEGLEHSLHDRFGVNAVTYKKNGQRITESDMPYANYICALIKKNPKGARRICDTLKMVLIHKAEIKRRDATEECAAGIYRMVMPVIRTFQTEGFISVCGRPILNTDRIYTFYIHKTIDEDEKMIKDLLASLLPIGPRTIKEMKHFIASYAK